MNLEKNVDLNTWNELLKNSTQGNIFSNYLYLELLEKKFSNYVLMEKNKPIIGAIIFEDDLINIPIFYNSLLIDKKINSPHEIVSKSSQFLENLDKYEKKIQIRSHYSLQDIRSFLWFNYHETESSKKFKALPRYTAVLDLNNKTFKDVIGNINSSRRQEIRKAEKNNCVSEISQDIEAFDHLNNLTYIRTRKRNELETFMIEKITKKTIKSGIGTLMLTKNKKNEPVAGSLFLHDSLISYYFLGGHEKNEGNEGAASLNIIDHISYCLKHNKKKIDFVGANSPNRGYFKTSFGADLKLYFEILK